MASRRVAAQGVRPLGGSGLTGSHRPLRGQYLPDPGECQVEAMGAQPTFGKVSGDVWRKVANASKHMLRTPPAWAVDARDLDRAEALGVRYVCIHDLEQMRFFWARPETLRRKGWTFERGFGEQVALSLDWWRSTPAEADQVAEGLREAEPAPAGVVQGALW